MRIEVFGKGACRQVQPGQQVMVVERCRLWPTRSTQVLKISGTLAAFGVTLILNTLSSTS